MKRDVNATLMLLLILTMASILALILYNTYTYHNLGKRYTTARKEIEKTYIKLNVTQQELEAKNKELVEREASLAEKEAQMKKYFQDLNLSKQRESSLGGMFDDLRDDNTQLRTDLEDLNTRLDDKDKEVDDLTKTYNAKVTQYNEVADYCNKMDVTLLEVEQELEDVEGLLSSLESDLNTMGDYADDMEAGDLRTNMKSEVNSANRKRKQIEDQLFSEETDSIEKLIAAMEYWATRFREARG